MSLHENHPMTLSPPAWLSERLATGHLNASHI
jgi:hypothetical protein